MLSPDLLKMLICPETRNPLSPASQDLIARLNQAIRNGRLTNRSGQKIERPLDGGLLPPAGNVLYPIVDDIPMLLVDEAIPLSQPALDN